MVNKILQLLHEKEHHDKQSVVTTIMIFPDKLSIV
jgi:hypothetical protein